MPAFDGDRFDPPAASATVQIRHPEAVDSFAEVLMMIDSGADATLLPRGAVESLGIVGMGARMKLLAFDNTESEFELVRADLVFADRHFLGQYLVIDDEIGLLGRDILNHVRLLLDGPALT